MSYDPRMGARIGSLTFSLAYDAAALARLIPAARPLTTDELREAREALRILSGIVSDAERQEAA